MSTHSALSPDSPPCLYSKPHCLFWFPRGEISAALAPVSSQYRHLVHVSFSMPLTMAVLPLLLLLCGGISLIVLQEPPTSQAHSPPKHPHSRSPSGSYSYCWLQPSVECLLCDRSMVCLLPRFNPIQPYELQTLLLCFFYP